MNDDTRPIVLVVDDTPDNLKVMSALLKDRYRVKIANAGEKALAIAQSDTPPDMILLDIMMPEMDGHEVCRRLKAERRTKDIPIIFLTAMTAAEDEEKGLKLGAVDYITKPISPPVVLARVETHLKLKASADFLRSKADFLEAEVNRRTREVAAIQDVTILAMASLAETRDSDTGNHIRRTQRYVMVLAKHLVDHPRFAAYLDEARIGLLYKSAPLHDIGKVGIPDRILLKPGRLEPSEFEIMKRHPILGREAIEHAEQSLGMPVEFLALAKEIALSHHEKWDGTGYPEGLSGDDIPISARLMAVADVYDALISRRIYKEGISHDAAFQILVEGAGTHFDPDVVQAFTVLSHEFRTIAERFSDGEANMDRKRAWFSEAIDQAPTTLPRPSGSGSR
ncbi:MAG TPA: two-component system response regulator [Holophaga sp.]|nr:two-component system response regulator [Holophaga sp.]